MELCGKSFDFNFIKTFVNESHLLCDMNKTEYTYFERKTAKKNVCGKRKQERKTVIIMFYTASVVSDA